MTSSWHHQGSFPVYQNRNVWVNKNICLLLLNRLYQWVKILLLKLHFQSRSSLVMEYFCSVVSVLVLCSPRQAETPTMMTQWPLYCSLSLHSELNINARFIKKYISTTGNLKFWTSEIKHETKCLKRFLSTSLMCWFCDVLFEYYDSHFLLFLQTRWFRLIRICRSIIRDQTDEAD